MFIDARSVSAGTIVDTDLCIIGAGAAGIAMALQFLSAGMRVALVEGGGLEYEDDTQSLYDGASVGRSYPGLTTTRMRRFGGTTNLWVEGVPRSIRSTLSRGRGFPIGDGHSAEPSSIRGTRRRTRC